MMILERCIGVILDYRKWVHQVLWMSPIVKWFFCPDLLIMMTDVYLHLKYKLNLKKNLFAEVRLIQYELNKLEKITFN